MFINEWTDQNCHSGHEFHRDKLQPESRVPGENRDPVFEMVPYFRRDDVWMPPYQVRGRLLKSGMTEKAIYGQTLFNVKHIVPFMNCQFILLLTDRASDLL